MVQTKIVEEERHLLGHCQLERSVNRLIDVRNMDQDEFIENHGSGTLRKAKKIGFAYRSQYLEERTAYEFGYGFEIAPRTHVMTGDGITEGDCHSVTEVGWHIERYMNTRLFPSDSVKAAYLNVQSPGTKEREGLGMYLEQTSAQFIPKGNLVYAIITEFDKEKGEWKNAENPF